MADEKFEPREINYRQWLPWTQIFRGFWVALDHKKLLLAAAGVGRFGAKDFANKHCEAQIRDEWRRYRDGCAGLMVIVEIGVAATQTGRAAADGAFLHRALGIGVNVEAAFSLDRAVARTGIGQHLIKGEGGARRYAYYFEHAVEG